jgi:hypothetical protein
MLSLHDNHNNMVMSCKCKETEKFLLVRLSLLQSRYDMEVALNTLKDMLKQEVQLLFWAAVLLFDHFPGH